MPSAAMVIESSCASATIDRMIAAPSPVPLPRTSALLILIVSNGKRCRYASEENPLPKSSSVS